jgi:hypothetical protein
VALSRLKHGFESRWGRQPSLACGELRLGKPAGDFGWASQAPISRRSAKAVPPEPRSGEGGLSLSIRELRLGKPATSPPHCSEATHRPEHPRGHWPGVRTDAVVNPYAPAESASLHRQLAFRFCDIASRVLREPARIFVLRRGRRLAPQPSCSSPDGSSTSSRARGVPIGTTAA